MRPAIGEDPALDLLAPGSIAALDQDDIGDLAFSQLLAADGLPRGRVPMDRSIVGGSMTGAFMATIFSRLGLTKGKSAELPLETKNPPA